MSSTRTVDAIRWYAALIATLVLGCALASGCGEGDDRVAPKSGGGVETELVSSGGCKRPTAAAKVLKSKRAGIVWAVDGPEGHIWACSRVYRKVFLIGSADQAPGKINPEGKFPPSFGVGRLSARSVGYYLGQDIDREIPERSFSVYYSAALKTGEVRKVREGLFGPG